MGMQSEFTHASQAAELERVLIEGATDPKWSDCRSAVKGFCRDVILPLYKQEVSDSYGLAKENPDIQKHYGS